MHKVLLLLKKIPKGKVTTYGEIARAAGTSPRAAGQILRRNQHPELYPCYKVVSASGRIHGYNGCLKGKNVSKKIGLLKRDKIEIKIGRIDLKKYMYKFN